MSELRERVVKSPIKPETKRLFLALVDEIEDLEGITDTHDGEDWWSRMCNVERALGTLEGLVEAHRKTKETA